MDIVALAADKVSRYGQKTADLEVFAADKADVSAAGAGPGLDGIADDCAFSERAAGRRHIYQDIGRALLLDIVIVLNVVADDLKVSHLTTQQPDAGDRVVTDVTVGNDCLMQIHFIEIYTDVRIVIDMAVVDYQVAIALHQLDPDFAAADQQVSKYGLHGSLKAQANRFRISAVDFKAGDNRHTLVPPDFVTNTAGVARTSVSADEMKRRPRPRHDNASPAGTDQ